MSRVKHNALHNFAAGVNSAPAGNPAISLPFSHPVQQGWKTYYEDFAGIAPATDAYFTATAIASGTALAGDSNSIKFTSNTSSDNSGYNLLAKLATAQLGGATKKFYFETVVKLTHASGTIAANEWFVGFTNAELPINSGGAAWDFEDGFGFGQLDGATPVFVTNSSDVEQSIALGGALTTAVYKKYACYFDGASYNLYEDDVLVATSVASPAVVADAPLGFNFEYKSGEAKTNVFNIKYALCAVEL